MDNTSSNEMEINEAAFPLANYGGNPEAGTEPVSIGRSAAIGKTIEDKIEKVESVETLEQLQQEASLVENGRRAYKRRMRELLHQSNTSL